MHAFHYAFKVRDLEKTIKFYRDVLNANIGRSTETWVDFDLFGHQLSAHLGSNTPLDYCGLVDGIRVPIPHFGCIVDGATFATLHKRLCEEEAHFIIPRTLRYEHDVAEHLTMFILDPSENPIEFKSYTNPSAVFTTRDT